MIVKERRDGRERRTWSEVSEGCLQRPLVMSWSVLSSSWSFGTERNVFFCPYLAKSWPAVLGPRPLKMRHKWPVWATLSYTPTGERSRKKWCIDAGFNWRLTSRKEREKEKDLERKVRSVYVRETEQEERTFFVCGGRVDLLFDVFFCIIFRCHFTCIKTRAFTDLQKNESWFWVEMKWACLWQTEYYLYNYSLTTNTMVTVAKT